MMTIFLFLITIVITIITTTTTATTTANLSTTIHKLTPLQSDPLSQIRLDSEWVIPRNIGEVVDPDYSSKTMTVNQPGMAYLRYKIDFSSNPLYYNYPLLVQVELDGAVVKYLDPNLNIKIPDNREYKKAFLKNPPGILMSLDIDSFAKNGLEFDEQHFDYTSSNHFAVPLERSGGNVDITNKISTTPMVRFLDGIKTLVAPKDNEAYPRRYAHLDPNGQPRDDLDYYELFEKLGYDKLPYNLQITIPINGDAFESNPILPLDYKITIGVQVPSDNIVNGITTTTWTTQTREFIGKLIETNPPQPDDDDQIPTESLLPTLDFQPGFTAFRIVSETNEGEYDPDGNWSQTRKPFHEVPHKITQQWGYLTPHQLFLKNSSLKDNECKVDVMDINNYSSQCMFQLSACHKDKYQSTDAWLSVKMSELTSNSLTIDSTLRGTTPETSFTKPFTTPPTLNDTFANQLVQQYTKFSCGGGAEPKSIEIKYTLPVYGAIDYRLNATDGVIKGVMDFPNHGNDRQRSDVQSMWDEYRLTSIITSFPSYVQTHYYTTDVQVQLGKYFAEPKPIKPDVPTPMVIQQFEQQEFEQQRSELLSPQQTTTSPSHLAFNKINPTTRQDQSFLYCEGCYNGDESGDDTRYTDGDLITFIIGGTILGLMLFVLLIGIICYLAKRSKFKQHLLSK